ncbi:MAG: amino acid dehydrogenase [Gammaproteobacteria bacterium]|nr:amino acid dehydrogenase [Gammaproteobacteria bacterium]MDH3431959.1 amino acid dehydrogenase [Gammaproteobacteria bacterium]
MAVFSDSAFDDHERVLFCRDVGTGLRAIIAIHSTVLGPAAGGTRLWEYANDDEAVHDALRLSQGMSYKNAMAGLKLGGGKAVIMKTPNFDGSDALYERFGEFVDSLNGDYITAEDVGMSVGIMETVARKTRYVTGLPQTSGMAGGDPSPKTAFGILCGIRAAARSKLGRADLDGLTVAVQGVGKVGYNLCRLLHEAGAGLVVADIEADRVARVCDEFGASSTGLDDILFAAVDVVSPCALGGVFNEHTIPRIQATIIAGGANNQLETPQDGQRIADRDILYAPDYVINGGGIINVACEYEGNIDDAAVMDRVAGIEARLTDIFEEAATTGAPTNVIADKKARAIIAAATT